MSKKQIISLTMGITLMAIVGLFGNCIIGYNNIQSYQILQSIIGNVSVKASGGYYFKFFHKVWSYPKAQTVFFSNTTEESDDNDAVRVIFSNKGRGSISSQVIFRLYTDNERMLNLHRYAQGDIEIVYNLILSKIKDFINIESAKITSSQAIEHRESFAEKIRAMLVNNKDLSEIGIVIEQFSITSIDFDDETLKLFKEQQQADLRKIAAKAEQENLEQQKLKTEAEWAQKIAEQKGMAEAEKIKAETDAERVKAVAVIEAQKSVQTADLARQQAVIEQQKLVEVAELINKQESVKLDTERLIAEQKIIAAQAKQQEIMLSGAATELEKLKLEYGYKTQVDSYKAVAQGISGIRLPSYMTIVATSASSGTMVDEFIKLLTMKTATELVD